jgi:hypothetical protein
MSVHDHNLLPERLGVLRTGSEPLAMCSLSRSAMAQIICYTCGRAPHVSSFVSLPRAAQSTQCNRSCTSVQYMTRFEAYSSQYRAYQHQVLRCRANFLPTQQI